VSKLNLLSTMVNR